MRALDAKHSTNGDISIRSTSPEAEGDTLAPGPRQKTLSNLTYLATAPKGVCLVPNLEVSECSKFEAQFLDYSMTSSARASMVGGATSPSVLAVLALMTSSKLLACSVGKSCGRNPFRIRSVSLAICRKIPGMLVP